jgi:hypothetical protein
MKYQHYVIPVLILAISLEMSSGCTSTPEKILTTKGFIISYRDKTSSKHKLSLGSFIKKIKFFHPVKILETDVRSHLENLMFEELSLFGKKKTVFVSKDIDSIARLLTKALHHVPSHKTIHYELETSRGTTEGNIFVSKKHIHWQFISINGMSFSGQAYTGWGNANWRMVPQSGQSYHETKRVIGTRAHENWIISKLVLSENKSNQKKALSSNTTKFNSQETESTPAKKSLSPALEKKLHFLKGLYKKNLIGKKEYKQKRKELFNSHL